MPSFFSHSLLILGYALPLLALLAVPYSIVNPEGPVWFKLCAMRPVQRGLFWGAMLCLGAVLIGAAELARLGRSRITAGKLLAIVLPVAVALHFAIALGEFWPVNRALDRAATAVAQGQSPYSTLGYGASPPLLQVTEVVQRALDRPGRRELRVERLSLVFDSLNVLFLALVALALWKLGRDLGESAGYAAGITLALIVCNAPLHNHVLQGGGGLWLFGFVCLAFAALPRHPFLAGVFLAAGALAQPLLLLATVPLLLAGEWRPLAAAFPLFLLLAGASASQPLGFALWSGYFFSVPGTRSTLVTSWPELALRALKAFRNTVTAPFARSRPTPGQTLQALLSTLLVFALFVQAGFCLRRRRSARESELGSDSASADRWPILSLLAQAVLLLLVLWPLPDAGLLSLALPAAFVMLAGRRLHRSALPLCAVFLALAFPMVGHPAALWARKAGLVLLLFLLGPAGDRRWGFSVALDRSELTRSLTPPASRAWRYGLYALLAVLALAAPPLLETLNPGVSAFHWRGLLGSAVLLVVTALELGRRPGRGIAGEMWIVPALFLVSAFFFLSQQTDFTFKHGDYLNYESGAKAVARHENPYGGTGYIYPPLQAEVMELAFNSINTLVQGVTPGANPERAWSLLFYLYDSLQFLQILLAWGACYWFGRLGGLRPLGAAVTTAILFVCNEPLQSTLTRTQINLWVLNASLLAMVLVVRAPVKAGWALAIGGHIKLYPLILLGPWAVCRRWVACMWAFVATLAILLLQTRAGTHWELWGSFLKFFREFPSGGNNPRNVNVESFVVNSLLVPQNLFGIRLASYVGRAKLVAKGLLLAWFAVRFLSRERSFAARSALADGVMRARWEMLRLQGHCVDALVFVLAMAPVVWHHHYVLGMPLAVWAVAHSLRDHPVRVFLGVCLLVGTLYTDVYPLAYAKIAGLCLLLWSTSPGRLARQPDAASPVAPGLPEPA